VFSWLSKKTKNQDIVDILGDYDPDDARVDELLGLYSSIKKRVDHSNDILRTLESTSSDDMIGDETAKIKDLIVKCYHDLENFNLDGSPYDSHSHRHEHEVYSRCASMIIPVLLKLGAHEEAKDLLAEIKIEQIRDELLIKHWQLKLPRATS
jgi:hypothetical protein